MTYAEKQYQKALANRKKYIRQMMKFPDKKLAKHIDMFREQQALAYKQNNHAAFVLLCLYESQTIEARQRKFDVEQKKKKQRKSPKNK